jgi:putative DNA primase/helicase
LSAPQPAAPPRPIGIPLIPDAVPDVLKESDQWLVWDWVLQEGKSGKPPRWTKPPFRIDGKGRASSTDAASWGSYRSALNAMRMRRLPGIGFALTADDPYCMGDLDDCRDPETGEIAEWAKPVLALFAGSYQEVSPSGEGIKLLIKATLPTKHNQWRLGADPLAFIYWYTQGRYTTLTGHKLESAASDITDCQAQLDALALECAKWEEKPLVGAKVDAPRQISPNSLSDDDLIAKALSAANGADFARLFYGGDTSLNGGDQSAADLALCNHLAFWCGPDSDRIYRLVKRSKLYDDKWDRDDYAQRTIAKAIDDRTEFYTPQAARLTSLPKPQMVQPTVLPSAITLVRPAPIIEARYTAPPAIAFRGWFGAYRDLMAPTTEAPDAFHLGASLVLAGMILGRRAHTYQGNRLFGNLYVVLVGPTGQARKDTAMNRALAAAEPAEEPGTRVPGKPYFHTMFDVTSSEGIIATLAQAPVTLVYMTELSMLLLRARRQSTSTLLTTLIKLWDAPDRIDLPTKNEPIVAHNALLSILTATTPDTLAEDIQPSDLASGFANRFLFFGGEGIGPKANPPRVDKGRRDLIMNQLRDAYRNYLDTGIDLSPEASAHWTDWYNAYYRWDLNNDEERQMVQRLGANVHKVALLYAATDGARHISLEHLQAAIAVVEWSWGYVRRELSQWGQEQEAKIADKIEAVLRRKGAIHKRLLQQALGQRLGPGTFIRVLEALIKGGRVNLDAGSGVVSLGTEGEEQADVYQSV